jgi:hypothetical protein
VKLHVLVVDEDPDKISSIARDGPLYIERGARPFVGRSEAMCEVVIPAAATGRYNHRIEHRGDSVFVVDAGGTNTVTVEGKRVIRERRLQVGDRIAIPGADVVLRLELEDVDLLRHNVVDLGDWIAFGIESFARGGRRRAYSKRDGSLAFIDRSRLSARALPRLVDTFVVDGVVHRAYEFAGGVRLDRLRFVASPCPPSIAARILAELATVASLLRSEGVAAPNRRDVFVGFDGSIAVIPSARGTADSVERAIVDAQMEALAVLPLEWPRSLEAPLDGAAGASSIRQRIAAFVEAHELASDKEIANVVAGLFPDELAAELQLREELACMDPSIRAMPARNRGDRS